MIGGLSPWPRIVYQIFTPSPTSSVEAKAAGAKSARRIRRFTLVDDSDRSPGQLADRQHILVDLLLGGSRRKSPLDVLHLVGNEALSEQTDRRFLQIGVGHGQLLRFF